MKHFKKGLTPLLCALTVFNFCCINTFAYSSSVNISEPYVSDLQSYVSVLIQAPSGVSFVRTYIINYEYAQNFEDVVNQGLASSVYTGLRFDDTNGDGKPNSLHVSFKSVIPTAVSVLEYSSDSDVLSLKYFEQMTSQTNYGTDLSTGYNFVAYSFNGRFAFINDTFNLSKDLDIRWGSEYDINSILNTINTSINNMNANLGNLAYAQNQNLLKIYDRLGELLNDTSTGSVENVSSSGITNVENKENALIGSNVSTNDLNVSINANAASVVWGLIDDLTTSNAKVFGMFISILTIAVIGLILNR